MKPEKLIPLREAANRLGCCTMTVRRMWKSGLISPPIKLTRLNLLPESEIDALIKRGIQERHLPNPSAPVAKRGRPRKVVTQEAAK